jgi:hypothetical protein
VPEEVEPHLEPAIGYETRFSVRITFMMGSTLVMMPTCWPVMFSGESRVIAPRFQDAEQMQRGIRHHILKGGHGGLAWWEGEMMIPVDVSVPLTMYGL